MRLPRKAFIAVLAVAVLISLVGAASYVWLFHITAPVTYGESLEFWYSDETLNGAWVKIDVTQTTSRPTVDLTKGVFNVKVLINNTRLRPVGVSVEMKAVDTATGLTTDFIGFNVTEVGFGWGILTWQQELEANALTSWNIRYVLSSEAPLGYNGFKIDWTVSPVETVVREKLEFASLQQGSHSGHTSSGYYVIQDNESWTELWNQHALFMLDTLPPPSVDFSKYTVVAVFMGEVNTGGYAMNIYDIVDIGSSLTVKLEKIEPGPKCIVTQALTQPYHMVQMTKTEKPIYFDVITKVIECP